MRERSLGFTLVEVLAVLLIIGAFAGSIGFSLERQSRGSLDAQAEQLGAWLHLARERAVLDGVPYAVRQSGDELELAFHYDYAWHPVGDAPLWRAAHDVDLELDVLPVTRDDADSALVVVFYPGGLVVDYAQVSLSAGADRLRLAWDPQHPFVPMATFERL